MANTSELVILTIMKQRIPKQLQRNISEASTGLNGKTWQVILKNAFLSDVLSYTS